jgi:hypothetical protein
MEPIPLLDRLFYAQQTLLQVPELLDRTLQAHQTTRELFATTITLRDPRVYQMEAHEVFRVRPRVAKGTSRSARVSSFTTHGHLRTTIAGETLRPATGLRPC